MRSVDEPARSWLARTAIGCAPLVPRSVASAAGASVDDAPFAALAPVAKKTESATASRRATRAPDPTAPAIRCHALTPRVVRGNFSTPSVARRIQGTPRVEPRGGPRVAMH
ncbi:MAG: hypothetical protein IPK07_13355 [Deltaproteobacteria bacterium]|nr:hypothetical protein [Deltaproteobacteria bacterium]